jgi:hypothetical protein
MATSQKSRFAASAELARSDSGAALNAASKRPVRVETNRMHPVYRLGDHALGVVCRSAKADGDYVMATGTGKARRLRIVCLSRVTPSSWYAEEHNPPRTVRLFALDMAAGLSPHGPLRRLRHKRPLARHAMTRDLTAGACALAHVRSRGQLTIGNRLDA